MLRGGVFVALLGALVCVPATLGGNPVHRPPVTWSPAGSGTNFTPSLHRRITTIVIHVTDGGSLIGNVSWLAADRSEASAHYVVSRDGEIVQLVPLHDIAWHSGNRKVNLHSIGIEHVGDTYGPDGFTGAEYRASARLVAWLVRRYGIPIDRRHIIGHSQVPDPFHPGLYGGTDHHTDPGPHWKWRFYLRLVRKFAFPDLLHVRTTSFEPGASVAGVVPWRVSTRGGRAHSVAFLVDGRVRWVDARPPFAFAGGRGLNTTTLSNGRHVLTVVATGRGARSTERLVVVVRNHVFALTTSALRPWQKVRGTLHVHARAWGARTAGIGLYVDGRVVSRDRSAPYRLRWDTRSVHDGRHRIAVVATSVDGRTATRRVPVVITNHPRKPRPQPSVPSLPPPQVTAANVADGQTVAGVFVWRVHTIGPVARVVFSVDDAPIGTSTREPWSATWDASGVAPGEHALTATAYTRDGRSAARTVTVTVAPAAP